MNSQTQNVGTSATPIPVIDTTVAIAPASLPPKREVKPRKARKAKRPELNMEVFQGQLPSNGAIGRTHIGQSYTKTVKGVETPVVAKAEVARLLSAKELSELPENKGKTPAQIDAIRRAAGKALKQSAGILNAVVGGDESYIVSSLRLTANAYVPTYRRIDKEDLATRLMMATGKTLKECKAFLGTQLVKSV